jgi:hypothetical protein
VATVTFWADEVLVLMRATAVWPEGSTDWKASTWLGLEAASDESRAFGWASCEASR